MCHASIQAKLRRAEEKQFERFYAALHPPNELPPLLVVIGATKDMKRKGESYWLVKPLEPPYPLEKVAFGLKKGYWVIKVQHYKIDMINKETNSRTYSITDEVNTLSLSCCVRNLRLRFLRDLVLSGGLHTAILRQARMFPGPSTLEDRTDTFFGRVPKGQKKKGRRKK